MTPSERAAARERCEKASKEPWEDWLDDCPGDNCVYDLENTLFCADFATADDIRFVAHARTDLPAALDALDAADAEIARLRADLQHAAARLADCSEVLGRRAERDGSRS